MYVYVGVGGGVCTWYNSRRRGAHCTTAGVGEGKEKQGHKTRVCWDGGVCIKSWSNKSCRVVTLPCYTLSKCTGYLIYIMSKEQGERWSRVCLLPLFVSQHWLYRFLYMKNGIKKEMESNVR